MGAAVAHPHSIPSSKIQPWLRRLRAQREKSLASDIAQDIFNDMNLLALVLYVLRQYLPLRVKGGAAFSLHAQRIAAVTLEKASMPLLDSLHLMRVHDLDVCVEGQSPASCFMALQGATLKLNEVLAEVLRAIKLPPFLTLAAAAPVSVGRFVNVEWRSACGVGAWPEGLSCSYHGVNFATQGSFALMRVSLCCLDFKEARVKRLHLIDVSCEQLPVAEPPDYIWPLRRLCAENADGR